MKQFLQRDHRSRKGNNPTERYYAQRVKQASDHPSRQETLEVDAPRYISGEEYLFMAVIAQAKCDLESGTPADFADAALWALNPCGVQPAPVGTLEWYCEMLDANPDIIRGRLRASIPPGRQPEAGTALRLQ